MSLKRSKLLSSAVIIVSCTVACASLSCLLSWARQTLSQEPPIPLPGPDEAKAILGIETERFFEVVPVVRTSDGMIYHYVWSAGNRTWEAGRPPGPTEDEPCQQGHRQALEEAAGALAYCREVQPPAEWCPAPVFAYAVDQDGRVWQLVVGQRCFLATGVAVVVLGVVGALAGIGIVLIRLLVLRLRST